jgi:hypothetical protein
MVLVRYVSPAASPENTLEAVSARQLTGKGYATNSSVCDDAAVKVLTANYSRDFRCLITDYPFDVK